MGLYDFETDHFRFQVCQQWGSKTKGYAYRASISVLKQDRTTAKRAYEIAWDLFLGWDYPNEDEAIRDAAEWCEAYRRKMIVDLKG